MSYVIVAFTLSIAGLVALRMLRGPSARREELVVLSRAGLSQRAGLAVVSVLGKRVLIGYGDGSPTLLMEISEPSPDALPGEERGCLGPEPEAKEDHSPPTLFSRALSLACSRSPLVRESKHSSGEREVRTVGARPDSPLLPLPDRSTERPETRSEQRP